MKYKILLKIAGWLLNKAFNENCRKYKNNCLQCNFGYGLDEYRNCILKEAYW